MAPFDDPGRPPKTALRVYTSINLLCALVLVLLAVEVVSKTRIPIADAGAPMGLLVLFFVIPSAAVFLWTRRGKPTGAPPGYFLASKIFWCLSWGLSCLPVIFYGAYYLHYMPSPWLSSRQGPDSPEALAAFTEYFEISPGPGSAHHIYHVLSPDLVLFRFEYADPKVVQKIITAMKLEPEPNCQLMLAGPPAWWQNNSDGFSCYGLSPEITWYLNLGIDEKNQRVFFKQFSP